MSRRRTPDKKEGER